jgi:hypothetical protein
MPRQNRVTPFGEFEASTARGLFMGNRGILHDDKGVLGSARWRHKSWVTCLLSYKGARRTLMQPGNYTELFFCDEATALAAGHRPCGQCRPLDYKRYITAWQRAHDLHSLPKAGEIDSVLHHARVTQNKRQVRAHARLGDLPDGAFISLLEQPGEAWLIWQDHLHRWSHEGYGDRRPIIASEEVTVLTPAPTIRVLAADYRPEVHPSVDAKAE